MRSCQLGLFNDALYLYVFTDFLIIKGPYYDQNKANSKLITCLVRGACAWLSHDGRKT
jgi:hypothetical protein